MTDTWAPIPGFEGRYEISDSGQVKVLAAPGRGRFNTDRILKLGKTTTGYVQVLLYPGGGRKWVSRRVRHAEAARRKALAVYVADQPQPSGERTGRRPS